MDIEVTEYNDKNSRIHFKVEGDIVRIRIGKQLFEIRKTSGNEGLRIIPMGNSSTKQFLSNDGYCPVIIPNSNEVTITTKASLNSSNSRNSRNSRNTRNSRNSSLKNSDKTSFLRLNLEELDQLRKASERMNEQNKAIKKFEKKSKKAKLMVKKTYTL
jgi:hypothetical protein